MLISLYRGMIVIALCVPTIFIFADRNALPLEPDIGAARNECFLNLLESEPLSFGAVVASTSTATWISMDTDSNVTAQRDKSFVGHINSKNHRHQRGVLSLSGSGLKAGSQIAVTFLTTGLSEGVALDNMQFDLVSLDNLVPQTSPKFQSLILKVADTGRVQADILFSGRLTIQNTVYGQINEDLLVESTWDCA